MKKVLGVVLAVALLFSLGSTAVLAAHEEDPRDIEGATRVYKFNIIGVDNQKNNDVMDNNGKRIFVDLYGASAIYLVEGDDFAILDANGTDDDGALIQLPDPDLDPYIIGEKGEADTMSAYSIYIRSLGKPEGAASITTCADVTEAFGAFLSNKEYKIINRLGAYGGFASVEQVAQSITERPKGKSKWYNVTAELLTIVFAGELYDESGNYVKTIYVRVPIFDEMLENEYWEYDNNGLKNLQVWIYDNSTDVSAGDENLPALPQVPQ